MELTPDVKAAVLLQMLQFHIDEVHRRQDAEKTWFEWISALLLATFGVVIALAGNTTVRQPLIIKILATVMISVPTFIAGYRILKIAQSTQGNARMVERIQEILHLFDPGYYDVEALQPELWRGRLAQNMLKRKTPKYYVGIISLMALCVIFAVWLVL